MKSDDLVDTISLRASAADLRLSARYALRPYRKPYRQFALQLEAAADELELMRILLAGAK